ncbi:MAG TPA: hypothetical protein PKY56_03415 [Candidatus Kapabacteria bacterium]|nr:hypothetical protein [Candidatus Kapabacteria bacterium]HPO63184.1 hypothetical protein [Candidatus Kapabacteria bacterium]
MKKLLFAGVLFIFTFAFIIESDATITAYSPSGWSSSSGLTFMIGKASNVKQQNNGYRVTCGGIDGTCYFISGNYLYIYNNSKSNQESEEQSIEVTITQQ